MGLRVLSRVLRTLNAIRLRVAARSETGPHRRNNQDAAAAASWSALVADGVGGGPRGDLASAVIAHRLVAGAPRTFSADDLTTLIRVANWGLRAQGEHRPDLVGMATTLTGVFVADGGGILLAHAGDSRGYLLRDGRLSRETRDDSFVQELLDRGLVSPEEAATHPRRHFVTASLRGGEDDTISIVDREARVGDRWLLCSDGVTDVLPDPLLSVLLAGGTPQSAVDRVITTALDGETRDNATAVVVDVVAADDVAITGAARPRFYGAAAEMFAEDLAG